MEIYARMVRSGKVEICYNFEMIEMKMRKLLYLVLGASCLLSACTDAEKPKSDLRAPAYPLVTIDPYTSAWSTTDNLYDSL